MAAKKKAEPKQPKPTREQVYKWLEETVPKCRQCPLCWGGRAGCGRQYARKGRLVYYRCEQCRHTWSKSLPPESMIKDAYNEQIQIPHNIHSQMVELDIR